MTRHGIPNLSVLTIVVLALLPGSALTFSSVVKAENVPAQLYSKTITVSYSSTLGGGMLAAQRVIYVSSKGRIFTRLLRNGGGSSDSRDVSLGTFSFSGGRIIGYIPWTQGSNVQQVTVSFDPSFRTCNASLRYGKSSSGQLYQVLAPNGKTFTSDKPPTPFGISCAIKDGNPF